MNAAISFTGGTDSHNKDGVVGTVAVSAGELKLRASTTTPAVIGAPTSLADLSLALSVEKPGEFLIDYDIPSRVTSPSSSSSPIKKQNFLSRVSSRVPLLRRTFGCSS